MHVHYNFDLYSVQNAVVTVGSFDGIHLGHFEILKHLLVKAAELSSESVVVTFSPHPRSVINPNHKIELLTTLDEKIELLRTIGINHLVIIPFTLEFAKLSACDFIEQILVKKLHIKHLVVGLNHHFGRNREGDLAKLRECGEPYGFSIEKCEAFGFGDENISSSKIRNALYEGNIEKVSKYLNRFYMLKGTVIYGNQIGRTLGFPTANLKLSEAHKILPKNGAYAVKVKTVTGTYGGMLNIGYRPTLLNTSNLSIEVHIFDFDSNIYEEIIEVYFVKKIRDEIKFESAEALKKQLASDKLEAKYLLTL